MSKRKARPILEDMLAYAEEARDILGDRDGAALRAERIRLLAVTRAVEIVGEATNQIPTDIVAAPPFDLSPAIAMRHRLIHDDFPALVTSLKLALAAPLPDEN